MAPPCAHGPIPTSINRSPGTATSESSRRSATQALRGYVGSIRAVNEDVEQRADAALATVERLESRLDEGTASVHSASDEAREDSPAAEETGRSQQRSPETDDHRSADRPVAHADDQQSDPLDAALGGSEPTDGAGFEADAGSVTDGIRQPSTVGGETGPGQRGSNGGRSEERPPGVLARIRSLL